MPTRRSNSHTSCASLGLHLSHCTSTSSAAAAYLYILSHPSRLRASSARSRRTCASRIRPPLSLSKVFPHACAKGVSRRGASMCSVPSHCMISMSLSMSRTAGAVGSRVRLCLVPCPSACSRISLGTTDAVFMEKPQYYDLVIDMTSFSPERASRPGLQLSIREPNGRSRKPSYRLSTIRFTWSDVKLVRTPYLLSLPPMGR